MEKLSRVEEGRKEEEEGHGQGNLHQPEIVELATLVLPSSAIESGLEAGEGNHVVLEACNETVGAIQSDNQEQSNISAIVDLEKVAELVHLSEQDFISGLHEDMQENFEKAAAAAAAVEEAKEEGEVDQEGEQQPLIPSKEASGAAADRISLPADPFIETLADVLPPPPTGEEDSDHDAAATEAAAAATTTEDHDLHLAHDAFLLDVPSTGMDGKLEHHYVLALPEIHVEPPSVASTISMESLTLLERAMSHFPETTRLPTDIETVHLEAIEHVPTKAEPSEVHLDIVVERKVPMIGYIILFSGLFALASVGAALDLQQGGVTPTMKTLWRQFATCVALSPLVVKSLRQDGLPNFTTSQLALLPICAASYTYMTLAFVLALDMTTLANAFVLSNMTSLVIIAGRAVLGLPILRAEGFGAITGFLGAAICADDASRTMKMVTDPTTDSSSSYAMLGNVVALSASFGTAAYLIIAKKLRTSVDLFVFMFTVMGIGSVLLFVFMILSGETMSVDMHPVHGIFGWLNLAPDRLPLEVYMAVVCNCLGTTGYIAVMKYFEPIVPATVMLLEPVIGALLGTAAGTAPLPGLQTWFGDLVVATGTFLVIWSGSRKKEKIDATEALRPTFDGTGEDSKLVKSPMIRKSPMINRKFDEMGRVAEPPAKVIWEL